MSAFLFLISGNLVFDKKIVKIVPAGSKAIRCYRGKPYAVRQ